MVIKNQPVATLNGTTSVLTWSDLDAAFKNVDYFLNRVSLIPHSPYVSGASFPGFLHITFWSVFPLSVDVPQRFLGNLAFSLSAHYG